MTDYVSIRNLRVPAVIGVHDWEREIEQTLIVSVDMAADVRQAAASDDLADALDYSAVAETIAAVLRDGKFRLIETAAERVADRLLADFGCPGSASSCASQSPAPLPPIPQPSSSNALAKFHDHEGFNALWSNKAFAIIGECSQFRPEGVGDGGGEVGDVCCDLLRGARAYYRRRHGGMVQGELQRGGG